jgi:hypothetical protein
LKKPIPFLPFFPSEKLSFPNNRGSLSLKSWTINLLCPALGCKCNQVHLFKLQFIHYRQLALFQIPPTKAQVINSNILFSPISGEKLTSQVQILHRRKYLVIGGFWSKESKKEKEKTNLSNVIIFQGKS